MQDAVTIVLVVVCETKSAGPLTDSSRGARMTTMRPKRFDTDKIFAPCEEKNCLYYGRNTDKILSLKIRV